MTGPGWAGTGPAVTLRAWGHPAVRGSHAKSIEVIADAEITPRATCVVGVGASLPFEQLRELRGPVVLTLRSGAHSDRVRAVASPAYTDPVRLVVRRSEHRTPETFATGADKAAADLDRALVSALADPGAELLVEIAAVEGPALARAEVRVLRCSPGAPAARSEEAADELSAASLVVDAGAGRGVVEALWTHAPPVTGGAEAAAQAWTCLERGEVVAVVGDPGLGHVATLLREAAAAGVPVRALAEPDGRVSDLLAAGMAGMPWVLLGTPPGRRHEREQQLAAVAELGAAAAWAGPAERLAALLAALAAHWPDARASVTLAAGRPDETTRRGPAAGLAADDRLWQSARGARSVGRLAADLSAGSGAETLRPLAEALLEAGVAPRTVADALGRVPGMSRRRAYRLALGPTGEGGQRDPQAGEQRAGEPPGDELEQGS